MFLSVPVRRHPLVPSVSSDQEISISSIRQSFIILHIVIQHWDHTVNHPHSTSSSHHAPLVRIEIYRDERERERDQTPGQGLCQLCRSETVAPCCTLHSPLSRQPDLADCEFQLRIPERLRGGEGGREV